MAPLYKPPVQADDAGEAVHDPEARGLRHGDQEPAVVGAEIECCQLGAVAGAQAPTLHAKFPLQLLHCAHALSETINLPGWAGEATGRCCRVGLAHAQPRGYRSGPGGRWWVAGEP